MGFTKLFDALIYSTVWREEMHVKVTWITMLALADRHGTVMASIPGLADAAKVSLTQCEDALERLASPDPYSRTKDYEGRRIEGIDGGWMLLNYAKYREMRDGDDRRRQVREAVQRHREKEKNAKQEGQNHDTNDATPSNAVKSSVINVSHGKPKQRQKQKQITTHLPAGLTGMAEIDAYTALREASASPRAFDASVATLVQPAGDAVAYTWAIVGQALLELHASKRTDRVSIAAVRAFCRRLVSDAKPAIAVSRAAQTASKQQRGRTALDTWLHREGGESDGDRKGNCNATGLFPRAVPDA